MRHSLIVFLCFCVACNSSKPEPKEKNLVEKIDSIALDLDAISVYQLVAHPTTDSILIPLKAFKEYNEKINDLAKLEPTGIGPFILTALIKCDALLKETLPDPFETPEVESRLKVVKTELLKARYYSQEQQQKELNESIREIFEAHQAYLKRIEDFAQEGLQVSSEDIKLNQR